MNGTLIENGKDLEQICIQVTAKWFPCRACGTQIKGLGKFKAHVARVHMWTAPCKQKPTQPTQASFAWPDREISK